MGNKYNNDDAIFKELEQRKQQAEQERKRQELEEATRNKKK